VRVGIAYLNGWNRDIGCVAWDDLMEDLATLEISRAQVWQWLRHGTRLEDGTAVTHDLVRGIFAEEAEQIEREVRDAMEGKNGADVEREVQGFAAAREDAEQIFTEERFRPFLTCRSELAGTDLETQRARLRAEGSSGTQAPL
jgi:malate synthase